MCLNLCDVGGPSVMFRVGFEWAGLCEKVLGVTDRRKRRHVEYS